MKNTLGSLMKQAQQMQSRMTEAQDALAELRVEGEAGGGLVRVTVDGKGVVKALAIDPSLVASGDVSVLEDLIVAACGAAGEKAAARAAETMREATGGLPLPPGFKLF